MSRLSLSRTITASFWVGVGVGVGASVSSSLHAVSMSADHMNPENSVFRELVKWVLFMILIGLWLMEWMDFAEVLVDAKIANWLKGWKL